MAEEKPSILRFENVSVAFEKGVRALDGVSFDMREGETRIVMGAAGSGKTVLLKTAMGLICPAEGRVFLFGKDVTNKPEAGLFDLRSRIGMLFQESALFDSMTVAQNVAYPLLNQKSIAAQIPPEQREPAVRDSLRFVELEQTMEQYPSELSGGMKRRVAIARAIVTNPPLLLYDAPTAGLDPITAHTIMALIIKERDVNNTTAMVVTYRYQDGNLVANFRYNPGSGRLEPVPLKGISEPVPLKGISEPVSLKGTPEPATLKGTPDSAGEKTGTNTIFMVLKEGRLIFEGSQAALEASSDPYLTKFIKRPERDAA